MVRRWSHIKLINHELIEYKLFLRRNQIRLFRKSVKCRKLFLKGTRFRRRKIMHIKHKTNWLIYYNIIKYWTDDIRVCRQHSRFQYMYKFFINNAGAAEGSLLACRHRQIYAFQSQWVSCSLTRKLIRSFGFDKAILMLNRHKHLGRVNAFFLTPEVKPNLVTSFFAAHFENISFPYNYDEENFVDSFNFLDFQSEILLQQHLEFYKIFVLLWYHKIGSFK